MSEIANEIALLNQQLKSTMNTGSYSLSFLIDLAMMTRRNLKPACVIAELRDLEKLVGFTSRTKPSSQFEREPLRGYWHKHHQQAQYIAQNVLLEMRKDRTIEKVLSKYIGMTITLEIADELTSAATTENYTRRSEEGRLTGEWIIYSRSCEINYYITIASHTEGDDIVAERIHRYEAIDKTVAWNSREKRDLVITPGPAIDR